MATKPNDPKDQIRPSVAELDAILVVGKCLPSPNMTQALKRHKGRTKPPAVIKNLRQIEEFCKEDLTRRSKKTGQVELTRHGKLLRDYARAILKPHREIRVWPPVYEIVIGATQRTASAYLPKLLARFLDECKESGEQLPFQITVREIDSRVEFFEAIANQEVDFGLRGLPISEDVFRGTPVSAIVQATSFGPAYRLVAVSRQPLPPTISFVECLRKQPIGILKMNMDEILALLARTSQHVFVPQRNIISCESYTVLMSFIQNSLCMGLVYVGPEVTTLKGLHIAELSDIKSHTRCYVFVNQSQSLEIDKLKFPKSRSRWRGIHYLGKLRDILWDPKLQLEALKPSFQEFPLM